MTTFAGSFVLLYTDMHLPERSVWHVGEMVVPNHVLCLYSALSRFRITGAGV